MGKASRGKRRNITRDDIQALRLAGEIVLDPRLIETFQSIKLHEKLESFRLADSPGAVPLLEAPPEPPESSTQESNAAGFIVRLRRQTPTSWASGMHSTLRSRPFRHQLTASIEAGRQVLRGASDFERQAAAFDLDEPAQARAERAYSAARERLLADHAAPGWLTLVMTCLARVIATNAHERFAAATWDGLTSLMYELERDFLLADGQLLADKLMEFDHVFYEDRLAEIIGLRMPFGLVELACNMADTGLFNPSGKP